MFYAARAIASYLLILPRKIDKLLSYWKTHGGQRAETFGPCRPFALTSDGRTTGEADQRWEGYPSFRDVGY